MLDPEDFDAIVSALNAGPTNRPRRWDADGRTARLNRLLEVVVELEVHELFLVAGAPPSVRINRRIGPIDEAFGFPLSSQEIEDAVFPALTAHARRTYEERGGADWSYRLSDVGRFRINLHRERGRVAAAIRRLPAIVPLVSSLNLPQAVEALSRLERGLVVVCGAAGSGKTTTLAALVNEINQRDARRIITIEDPIEYEHAHGAALVEQIEVGVDAPDFATALRGAVRQGPDVIAVGDLRDPETTQAALAAGEAGLLVLAGLQAAGIVEAISRIVDLAPSERRGAIRQSLSVALTAVMTQTLIPKRDGGAAPAAQLLVVDHGVRQRIRRNTLRPLAKEIAATEALGSFTLEACLADLARRELVDRQEALARAARPAELKRLLSSDPPRPGQG